MNRLDRTGSWFWSHQWLGVTQDVVLEELVQHVEEVVLHQRLDHQLILVMLQHASAHVRHTPHKDGQQRGTTLLSFTWTGIWYWFRERMYSISTAMTNL